MAVRRLYCGFCLLSAQALVLAQDEPIFSFTNSFSVLPSNASYTATSTRPNITISLPTGQITVTSTSSLTGNFTGGNQTTKASNSSVTLTSFSDSQITVSTTTDSLTYISGNPVTSTNTGNSTASSTTSSNLPMNTVPCNGFPEFCNRKYSNITNICSHNAAFVVKNNAASNQMLPIADQLTDGVRMLEGETHYVNDTIYNCHTSCDLLNVGPWQLELETVAAWLRDNPYEVVTILISNSDFVSVEKYVPAITNSGLLPYVYTPSYIPQYREQWPTLGEMILRNQRVVFFMDYNANQTAVPYILDQYSHVWQTPFSPTNISFPCTIATPSDLSPAEAKEKWMYLANHNLNSPVDISAILGGNYGTILIPDTAHLNVTNAQGDQLGMLGATLGNCTEMWGLPPNFLVVDYFNIGSPEPCSVFHVAAKANNVTYTQNGCKIDSSPAPGFARLRASAARLAFLALALGVGWMMLP